MSSMLGSSRPNPVRTWHVLACGPKDLSKRCINEIKSVQTNNVTLTETVRNETSVVAAAADYLRSLNPQDDGNNVNVFMGLSMGAVLALTMLFNLVVLAVFVAKPRLRTRSNMFIISLALADLGVAAIVMPLSLATYANNGFWPLGDHACRFWLFSDCFFCTVSVVCLVFVGVDRFQAVSDPLSYSSKRSLRKVVFMLLSSWIVSLILTFPTLLVVLVDHFSVDYSRCLIYFNQNAWFVVLTSSLSYFLPVLVLCLLYSMIFLRTSRSTKVKVGRVKAGSRSRMATPEVQAASVDLDADDLRRKVLTKDEGLKMSLQTQQLDRKLQTLLNRERRLLRVILVLISAFLLCWTPFWTAYLASAFCRDWCLWTAGSAAGVFQILVQWAGYANSAANPVVYTAFNGQFRKGLLEVWASVRTGFRKLYVAENE